MQWHGFRTGTKLILWTLFFIQLLLIGAFWILQGASNEQGIAGVSDGFTVDFIKAGIRAGSSNFLQKNELNQKINGIELKSINNFSTDFVTFLESGDQYLDNLTCFREGIISDVFNHDKHIKKCHCKPDWHGKDCGQPEVVWRAFMTAKVPSIVSNARTEPHKVIYMITGNFFSLELLEIQVMELESSTDFFIICNKRSKRLKLNFASEFQDRILLIESNHNNNNCTPKLIYNQFKSRLDKHSTINQDDIFIFSQDDQILNRLAIKYLKYYDNSLGVIRFRLKYNVYGFFWQHPESTRLGSVACKIRQLDENFKSDPQRLLTAKKSSITIGDLNHIGGWYCRLCYQPSEIVDRLEADSHSIFPNSAKNRQIDARYIQNLIASGLYIDGKLGLNKLHRYSDKYYAPEYVEQNGWRFDNILVNLFLSFDDNEYDS